MKVCCFTCAKQEKCGTNTKVRNTYNSTTSCLGWVKSTKEELDFPFTKSTN